MLIGLGIGLFVFEKLVEVDEVGIIKKIGVKNLCIDIFEKIILAFFFEALQAEEELKAKESFDLLGAGFDSLVEWIDLMKIFDGLGVFESFGAVVIQEVWI